ncbi:MAG: protein-disulfide reductase DsbD family protein [Melioribacteraceae bacterium]|nr:MAG: protein-disulfide reductase DsbD family protein [Melioribacteraceae bacterium]
MKILKIAAFTALFAILNINAQSVRTDYVESELISEVQSIQPGTPFWLALRLKMDEHWHTYWLNAGDAGLQTKIEWKLPEGFTASKIHWPYPEKIYLEDLANFGYEGEVFLLTKITPPNEINSKEVQIFAEASWLVCKIECLPGEAEHLITIPVKSDTPQPIQKWQQAFADTRFNLPLLNSDWKITSVKNESGVSINILSPDQSAIVEKIEFFPYEGSIFQNAVDQKFSKKSDGYILTIPFDDFKVTDPDSLKGILVSSYGWRGENSEKALEVIIPFGEQISPGLKNNSTIWMALIFAFIGGMILNLMPCVLPVLSIKIMGFVQQSGEDKKKIINHGLMFTVGVLISFWILAGALLGLRAGGEELGWGFQLQSPAFIIILSVFLFLFALNLFGVFEIGTSLMSIGSKSSNKSGSFGAFMSGVTATVVATPCTAPFMGTALGFAIVQPPIVTMIIFTSLALGMAFPYLLLTIFPAWLKFLPKPGAWMETLKQFMGFPLVATVIWLVWVLGLQTGSDGVASLLMTLLLASLGVWIYGKWGTFNNKNSVKILSRIVTVVLIIAGLFFGISTTASSFNNYNTITNNTSGVQWEKFSQVRVDELRAEGRSIFIDFTAAWCLTCQVNERAAINKSEVIAKLNEKNVVALKADWTSRDDEITKALAKFGRNSVPLYVIYSENLSEPLILPEILTTGIVLEALEKIN